MWRAVPAHELYVCTWLRSLALTEGTEWHKNVIVKKEKNIIPNIKEELEQNNAVVTDGSKGSSVVIIDQKQYNGEMK